MPSDELVSIAVAGQAAGVSERTVRRWVSAGHVSAMSAPGGRLVRLADVIAYAAQQRTVSGHVSGRPVSAEVSGAVTDMSGPLSASALVAQAVQAAVLPLVATIQQQAIEIGALRERVRALEAPQAPTAAPPSPEGPPPTPPPAARPAPSLRARVGRWLRG